MTRIAVALVLVGTLTSFAAHTAADSSAAPKQARAKVDAIVTERLKSGQSTTVLIQLVDRGQLKQLVRQTDAIEADPTIPGAEKKKLTGEANLQFKQDIERLAASVVESIDQPGGHRAWRVQHFVLIVVTTLTSSEALDGLLSNPNVEGVYFDRPITPL